MSAAWAATVAAVSAAFAASLATLVAALTALLARLFKAPKPKGILNSLLDDYLGAVAAEIVLFALA